MILNISVNVTLSNIDKRCKFYWYRDIDIRSIKLVCRKNNSNRITNIVVKEFPTNHLTKVAGRIVVKCKHLNFASFMIDR